MRVVIVGCGGHGQVVADVLLCAARAGSDLKLIGFVDDDPAQAGLRLLGVPVLGRIEDLSQVPHEAVVVAIGDNPTRRAIFNMLSSRNERFLIARHPAAVVADSASIGPGTMICAGAIVNPYSSIGANVILNTGCTIDHHNQIGDHVHIAPGVHTGGTVTIKDDSLVGIGATIMPGLKIGVRSTVGAGALVDQDVPSGATVVGVPARALRAAACGRRRA
jgi:sugar O-acyltransferase (sialic acid O-acetyltransferase NeuD family)